MKDFVSKLLANKLAEAKNDIDVRIKDLVNEKINQVKTRMAAEMSEEYGIEFDLVEEDLQEANVMRMGRTKLIRVRIRKGKIQRRKKLSAIPGYTIRGGKMTRMSPLERRHRKMGARRSKFKRRAKLKTALRKRKISLRRRRAMGLR